MSRGHEKGASVILSEILRVLGRRWYIVVLGLCCTAGGVVGSLQSIPPDYSVTSELLLLPPNSVVPAGSNPYLVLGGLESIGSVASKTMTDDRAVRLLKSRFGELDYSIGLDPTAAAPMLLIHVESNDPQRSVDAERFLRERLPTVFDQLQDAAAVPDKSRITSTVIIEPDRPKILRKAQIRLAVAATALGLMATVMLAALIDARAGRRRRGRNAAASDAAKAEHPTEPPALSGQAPPQADAAATETADSTSGPQGDVEPGPTSRTKDLSRVSG